VAAWKEHGTRRSRSWSAVREAFGRAKPILNAMGRTVTHFGPNGAGQAAKATNQIMCAG